MSPAAYAVSVPDVRAFEHVEAEGYRELFAAAPVAACAELSLGWGRVSGAECRVASAVPAHRMLNHVSCAGPALDVERVREL